MRKTLATAALCLGLASGARAADLTPVQATICQHLLAFYPTDSPLDVALGTPDNVQFTCQAGAGVLMQTITLTWDDQDAINWWIVHTADRVVCDGDTEAEDFQDRLNLRPTRAERGGR